MWKLSIEHVISSEKGEKVELGGGVRKEGFLFLK